jgi:hypothetical protein
MHVGFWWGNLKESCDLHMETRDTFSDLVNPRVIPFPFIVTFLPHSVFVSHVENRSLPQLYFARVRTSVAEIKYARSLKVALSMSRNRPWFRKC